MLCFFFYSTSNTVAGIFSFICSQIFTHIFRWNATYVLKKEYSNCIAIESKKVIAWCSGASACNVSNASRRSVGTWISTTRRDPTSNRIKRTVKGKSTALFIQSASEGTFWFCRVFFFFLFFRLFYYIFFFPFVFFQSFVFSFGFFFVFRLIIVRLISTVLLTCDLSMILRFPYYVRVCLWQVYFFHLILIFFLICNLTMCYRKWIFFWLFSQFFLAMNFWKFFLSFFFTIKTHEPSNRYGRYIYLKKL